MLGAVSSPSRFLAVRGVPSVARSTRSVRVADAPSGSSRHTYSDSSPHAVGAPAPPSARPGALRDTSEPTDASTSGASRAPAAGAAFFLPLPPPLRPLPPPDVAVGSGSASARLTQTSRMPFIGGFECSHRRERRTVAGVDWPSLRMTWRSIRSPFPSGSAFKSTSASPSLSLKDMSS